MSDAVRIDWIDRQLLAGRDLRDALRALDVLRRRHVRGMHATWGVALGLAVEATGTRTLRVAPGLAYDAAGRELLVADPVELRVPAGAAAPLAVCARAGHPACAPEAQVRLAHARDPVRPGTDVVLAAVDPATGSPSPGTRRHARSLAPPRVAAGFVPAGGVGISGTPLRFTAAIDTSAAGFARAPTYVVQPTLEGTAVPPGLGPLLAVDDPGATGFTLAARVAFADADSWREVARDQPRDGGLPFGLAWLGVEPAPAPGVAAAPSPPACLP